ncbi:MAG: imidazole glycerol phosphate synthase subunit HisH [Gemmatimonadetes bacterium]|jgi:imidazole glycerol-phosphate synthase subunit HisH|nr:imidazole glycerol phosphate synthase subunit HisH [Gemmatimonadota bacterium]
MKIALFDYGAGNLHSLGKAVEALGPEVVVTSDWPAALALDALLLPGVGAFGHAAAALPDDLAPLRSALEAGLPCLGICLGMQLLFDASDESAGEGIGYIPGRVTRLKASIVPQMGWNDVETGPDPIFDGVAGLVAYYANSFVCAPGDPDRVIATSEYAGVRFAASARRANTWGLQFHPEKSSTQGRRILENWVALARGAQ